MAEQKNKINGGFFHSLNNDRQYSAEDMNKPYKRIISDGVFATPLGTPSTDFQVLSANNGMNIIIKKGWAMLGGKWIESENDLNIEITQNNNIVPRIDSIILQLDTSINERCCNIIYREGTPNSSPMPPDLTNIDNIIEMRIANILLKSSVNKVTQDLITDLRGSAECLWVTSLIKQVDTSQLFKQWEEAYKSFYELQVKSLTDKLITLENDFNNWFLNIKNLLDTDQAGHLSLEIEDLNLELNNIKNKVKYISIDEDSTIINSKVYLDENKTKDVVVDVTEISPTIEEN